MKYVLLLEPNRAEAEPLIEKIESNNGYKVIHITHINEATMELGKRPFQFALIPITPNDQLIHTLQSLQPNLPIILLADYEDRIALKSKTTAVWGLITKAILLDTPPSIEKIYTNHLNTERQFWLEPRITTAKPKIDMAKLAQLAQRVLTNKKLQFVLLSKEAEIINYHNHVQETQLMAVAEQVNESWDARPRTAQIQYFENSRFNSDGTQSNSLLLFTRPFQNYLLTLGAAPDTSITELRQASNLIVERMTQEQEQIKPYTTAVPQGQTAVPASYSLLCLLKTSLSAAQTTKIERIIQQVSEEHECSIEHIELADTHLHLVATCPPYRTGSWLADLFKQESSLLYANATLTKQELWHDTYYVKASAKPLSQHEIDLFLELATTAA